MNILQQIEINDIGSEFNDLLLSKSKKDDYKTLLMIYISDLKIKPEIKTKIKKMLEKIVFNDTILENMDKEDFSKIYSIYSDSSSKDKNDLLQKYKEIKYGFKDGVSYKKSILDIEKKDENARSNEIDLAAIFGNTDLAKYFDKSNNTNPTKK
jgi:hypothetical protein